jgi:hypothetical protein
MASTRNATQLPLMSEQGAMVCTLIQRHYMQAQSWVTIEVSTRLT